MTDKAVNAPVWNAGVDSKTYEGAGEKYQAAIMEQYKLYVDMAERVNNRRGLTNTFFLTLNISIFAAIGAVWTNKSALSFWFLLLFLVVLIGECASWWFRVNSYRLRYSAKFKVIGVVEERLASLYSRGEFAALNLVTPSRPTNFPLANLEQLVPVLFVLVYLAGFFVLLTK